MHMKPINNLSSLIIHKTDLTFMIMHFSVSISQFAFPSVIPESGRCFVWGENQSGQLGIGTCENATTKPSCVKEIKKLGQKVKDIQFGSNFSIILTGL